MKPAVVSQDCHWNARTLPYPVHPDGLTLLSWQLLTAGSQVRLLDIPNKGLIVMSWRRHAN